MVITAMVGAEALRGLVLEEFLARLLRDSGYHLLVTAEQDLEALSRGANGLQVRGRGGNHQADVLGELTLPLPFSLPLRIFVEAKSRKKPLGIEWVRNAHGIIHDVNEQVGLPAGDADWLPVQRYQYRYSLFSTSGFTVEAQKYALVHQISLVDLSGSMFDAFRYRVQNVADRLLESADRYELSPFPTTQVRSRLRKTLGTWTADDAAFPQRATQPLQASPSSRRGGPQSIPEAELSRLLEGLDEGLTQDLMVGFPRAPFILVLKEAWPGEFVRYLERNRGVDVRVHIEFSQRGTVSGDWVIVPARGSEGFRLEFSLPDLLADWLLNSEGPATSRARDIKSKMLSSLVMFNGDRMIRLLYEPHPERKR